MNRFASKSHFRSLEKEKVIKKNNKYNFLQYIGAKGHFILAYLKHSTPSYGYQRQNEEEEWIRIKIPYIENQNQNVNLKENSIE